MIKDDESMSNFYCVLCGNKGIPIFRRKGHEREAGHLKKLFCLKCGKETNHAECKPWTKYDFEDFRTEFEYGNFNEKGNRVRPYGELNGLIHNGEIEKVKTLSVGGNPRFREEHLD